MSTKIYSGFELQGQSLESALVFLQQIRRDLREQARQRSASIVANLSCGIYDRAFLGWPSSEDEPAMTSARRKGIEKVKARQQEIKSTHGRDPAVDFEFQLILVPFEGRLFGVCYTEQPDFLKYWNARPGVKDFAYWNNSDAPDSVSEVEWAERKRIWDGIFAKSSIPAEVGYCVDVLPVEGMGTDFRGGDEMYFPTLEARAKSLALEGLLQALDKEGRAVSELSQVMRLSHSPEVAQVAKELESVLKANLNFADLNGELPSRKTPYMVGLPRIEPKRPKP